MLSKTLSQTRIRQVMAACPLRGMKLHEYQAGALLHKYKCTIPLGNVARTPDEAFDVCTKFKSSGYVVKA
jgi:hypothetical protein